MVSVRERARPERERERRERGGGHLRYACDYVLSRFRLTRKRLRAAGRDDLNPASLDNAGRFTISIRSALGFCFRSIWPDDAIRRGRVTP